MKKRSFAVLSLAMVLALAVSMLSGCSSKAGSTSSQAGDESASAGELVSQEKNGKSRPTTGNKDNNALTTAYSGTVSTIDPELFTSQDEDTVLAQIYEPLFLFDNKGEMKPYLAESWTQNDDGSVDFTLRSNVKFHSGDTLTSEDVEYTLGRTKNSPVCSAIYGNVEMTITDDTHFTWTFPNQDNGASFNDLSGYIQAMDIVNKSWAEGVISDPNDDLVYNEDGTGPYTFGGIESSGDITLNRFDGYWGDASIDTIYFKHLTGDFEVAFESGDLDVAQYSSPDNFKNITADDNVQGTTQPVNRVGYITMNSTDGKTFASQDVRKAVAYAINRDDLAYAASNGTGTTAYNLATPLTQFYTDNADHFDQDIDKSKELLESAGYSESKPAEVTLVAVTSNNDIVTASELLKEMLEQSYFKVTIEETPDMTRIQSGDYDLALTSIGLLPSFGSYSLIFKPDTGLDFAGAVDEDVNQAFADAKDEAGFQNAMKVSTESCYYIPVWYPSVLLAADGDLNVGEFNTSLTCYLFGEFSWK